MIKIVGQAGEIAEYQPGIPLHVSERRAGVRFGLHREPQGVLEMVCRFRCCMALLRGSARLESATGGSVVPLGLGVVIGEDLRLAAARLGISRLNRRGNPRVEFPPAALQEAVVRQLANETMLEGIALNPLIRPWMDQLSLH